MGLEPRLSGVTTTALLNSMLGIGISLMVCSFYKVGK